MEWLIIALSQIDPQAIWIAVISGLAMVMAGASATILSLRSRKRQDGTAEVSTFSQLNSLVISNAMELLSAEKERADRADARADRAFALSDKLQKDLDTLREEMYADSVATNAKIAAQQRTIGEQQAKIAVLEYQLSRKQPITVNNPESKEAT